jgi:dTDP-4-amino-4,6-dideoxygalactose transaminase
MIVPGHIPFDDLIAPHLELQEDLLSAFKGALKTGTFIDGSMVEDFEQNFARFCETGHCIGVSSGREALRLALIAAGVARGDIVVTAPNASIATAEAITQAGGRPDFVDIDERTFNLDATKLREYLETRCYTDRETGRLFNKQTQGLVRAVVPVHLYGQMADMDAILELAEQYNLVVIEDASQAHGAGYFSNKEQRWRNAGSVGHAAAFSFYPGKNLGAFGEAGAVTSNNAELAERVRVLRHYGHARKYFHEIEGYSLRLDAIQAGILQIKLKHLAQWNKKRRENAFCYHGLLSSALGSITIPYEPSWTRAIYHLYVIRAENRDQLQSYLAAANIATRIHYPVPLHLQESYRELGHKPGDFPIAEKAASEILSLPVYPQLEFDQQYRVAQKILNFLTPTRVRDSYRDVETAFPA